MGLFDFILNGKNKKDRDDNNDELCFLPPHMEVFEFDIDKLLYSEQDIINGMNEEFEDFIECEMVFSKN